MQNAFCIHYSKDICFFPTEDQRQKRIPWLTHLYSLPPNSTEILQAILEAKTMERLAKNKLTRTSERRKRLKKFQFSAVACTSKENDTLLGTDRKHLEKRPINYYAPANDIWVWLFFLFIISTVGLISSGTLQL